MSQYTRTVTHSWNSFVNAAPYTKPGQWVAIEGERGQFLGITRAGVYVINWPQAHLHSATFTPEELKAHARKNRPLRTYARQMGSK